MLRDRAFSSDDGTGDGDSGRRDDRCRSSEIQVVDAETGEGVPLVVVQTIDRAQAAGDGTGRGRPDPFDEADPNENVVESITDSAGRVALNDAEYLARSVLYHVDSHGYEEQIGSVAVPPGGKATIEIERENVAERAYRVSGRGIYRDSVLLGHDVPLETPVLNSQVTGHDSANAVVYDDRVFWIWGDTHRIGYPLGNFRSTGGTSELPENGGLDPADGVDIDYYAAEDGFVASMAPLPSEEANIMWLDQLVVVPDENGAERLVARYNHVAGLTETVGRGLLVFDDETERFEILKEDFDLTPDWEASRGQGKTTLYEDPETGESYWFSTRPWPVVRVPNDFAAVQDRDAYEWFTCLEPGADFAGEETDVHRDEDGEVVWDWKPNTHPLNQQQERQLIDAGLIESEEARFQLADVETGESVVMHGASIRWNEHREKWIMIGNELGGTSNLGEVWYAEADSPTGPWRWGRKIVSHDDYSFYNPSQHDFFDQEGGRYVYFEGTYTNSFSGSEPTPMYDYDQMMYRLDLEHPQLDPPLEP